MTQGATIEANAFLTNISAAPSPFATVLGIPTTGPVDLDYFGGTTAELLALAKK
jgi:hypothetical protein